MSRDEQLHWDVAAYALGVLDPRETARYEQHLSSCATCAMELERLLPVARLMADVDPHELRAAEDPQLADRLLRLVHTDRRRARARRRISVGAGALAAAALAAGALFAGANWLEPAPAPETVAGLEPSPSATPSPTDTDEPDSEPEPDSGVDGPDLGQGEPFTATDPETGVQADVRLATKEWGTELKLALSSLTGPRDCQLLVMPADGSAQVLATWSVPEEGYGTPQREAPLLVRTATAWDIADMDQLQVQVIEPNGEITALVTVPL